MASANISEEFLCSICLDVFTEPVSTPCGHNYCRACISSYWSSGAIIQCPLCKETFLTAPKLRVNTEFRDMLEISKKTKQAAGEDGGSPAGPGDVPCDLCEGNRKRKAVKSCLVCVASYCDAHLKPHRTVQKLKWHQLINPVDSLEERVCRKHNKVMESFCKRDQCCLCSVCLKEDHVGHHIVSLGEEFKARKTILQGAKMHINNAMNDKCNMVFRMDYSMTQSRQKEQEANQALAVVVAAILSKRAKLMEVLEEKQEAEEQKDKALKRQLWLEIAELRETSVKMEEALKTEDEFGLLQNLPPLPSALITRHCYTERKSLLQVEKVWRAGVKIEETLNEHMDKIIREVLQGDEEEEAFEEQQTGTPFDDELVKIQEQHAVKVTLDPNTAHPSLIVSEDATQVGDGVFKRNISDNPKRFDSLHFVLGNEGFSSGKIYYEVSLEGLTGWEVGVVRESINRKGVNWSLTPENGCWTLGLYWGRCQANSNPPVHLPSIKKLQKVGVFVDLEKGFVSFYNVDTRAQIYSFTGCVFESTSFLRKILAFWARTRIYPLFRPSAEEGSAPLRITKVSSVWDACGAVD
ncbi:probable E3 ubiquitin-protein ligase TRIML1 isoform X1 [Trematomus bernacchii]|uniref:probable E3 ubiquitin-protein ligase TRIML1 isoform X1 n=1 Tax=Trematomus bernacchii TaxID=40690 RepID=UPI00146DF850|nr:probable E3 ubiquitin-protein ligase TRIML1 isoform X1 [Trematomus bernacchii]XP_033978483.1 probable E3 ubiquitin-protein ligase TRIML1 isoform X1 [Trematomus bernacchii]